MAQHHNMSEILLQVSALQTHLVCTLMFCPVVVYGSPIHLQANMNASMGSRVDQTPPNMDTSSQTLEYGSSDIHHRCHHVHMTAQPHDQYGCMPCMPAGTHSCMNSTYRHTPCPPEHIHGHTTSTGAYACHACQTDICHMLQHVCTGP